MNFNSLRASALAVLAMAGLSGAVAVPNVSGNAKATLTAPTVTSNRKRALTRGQMVPQFGGRKGPGWSHAQVQRMARKKRAVKANRKNHKG